MRVDMISSHCFSQLVQTLHHANARLARVALLHRSTLHLTHHAKRTASHLRIDTCKARTCPIHFVSRQALPLLESSPLVPVRTTTLVVKESTQAMDAGVDAMVSTALGGLHHSYPDLLMASDIPTPGAPLLRPRQLPDVDVSELPFDSPISSSGKSLLCIYTPPPHPCSLTGLSSCGLLTPPEVYTGLRIIIPARHKKRKLQDAKVDWDDDITYRVRRMVVNRRMTSPIRRHEYIHA
ncbi:hypothetical protein EDC04DRAFT_2597644 [Pisolithus marmoratus]|nr:hypothetical protein EDC04DRAFT_2597644 [Pisolithus marmoratus]